MVRLNKPPLLLLLLLLLSCSLHSVRAIVCYHCDSIALPECAQTLREVGVLPYEECTNQLSCAMSIGESTASQTLTLHSSTASCSRFNHE